MTSCSEVLLEIKPIFGDCSRHRLEKARLERWTSVSYARQVWGQACRKGAFTMTHMCTLCHLMPKDDFMWYLAKDTGHKGIGRKTTGTSIHGAFCGGKSKAQEMSCVVTVQYGLITDTCMMFSLRPCKNFLDALIMANNAHEPRSRVRALGKLSDGTMDRLAEVWYEWDGEDDAGQMLKRQQFEEQITVRRIQCPHVDDDFEIHQDALTLLKCGR